MSSGGAQVPLVSDVLEQLVREFGNDASQRPVLFQAALQVCARESKRVKQGQPSAPLEVLVDRARAILAASRSRPIQQSAPDAATPVPAPAPAPSASSTRETPPAPADEVPDAAAIELGPADPLLQTEPTPARTDLFSGFGGEPAANSAGGARGARRTLVLVAVGLVALAVLGYAGLRWLGVFGSSDVSRPVERAPASQAPAAPSPTAASAPSVQQAGNPEPAAPAPGVQTAQPVPAGAATPPRPKPPAGYTETMPSPDWVGHTPIYVVHFSSYRGRVSAEREAAEMGKRYGRPAYAAEVTIPDRGTWYRVVVGDFETAAEARAFRSELIDAGTPGVGAVYWIVGP